MTDKLRKTERKQSSNKFPTPTPPAPETVDADAPRLVQPSRHHLFAGLPIEADIRTYFLAGGFLDGPNRRATARNLVLYAGISRGHWSDVQNLKQLPRYRRAVECHTGAAILKLARFRPFESGKKKELADRVDFLASSNPWVTLPLNRIANTSHQEVVLFRVLHAKNLRRVTIDLSHRTNPWRHKNFEEAISYPLLGSVRSYSLVCRQLALVEKPDRRAFTVNLIRRNRVITRADLLALAESGANFLPRLQILDLSGFAFLADESNFFGMPPRVFEALNTLLASATNLKRLALSDSVLDSDMLGMLCKGLPALRQLRELSLANNLLRCNFLNRAASLQGFQDLLAVLPLLPALQRLDLSGNNLGDAGADLLLAALKKCPALRVDVSNCGISDAHAARRHKQIRIEPVQ